MTTPYVRIVEQNSRSSRFRYVSEGRPGNLSGSGAREVRTSFAIEVGGYVGRVAVVLSCVTKDPPYRQHPYRLVGKNCKKGVCTLEVLIGPEGYKVVPIEGVAIQCVPQKDSREELNTRRDIPFDPFQAGFDHASDVKGILKCNYVRLCFQLYGRGVDARVKSEPVVSDPILNTKTLPDPVIHRVSHCNSPVSGRDDDIILLCTKINRNDIHIRFFEVLNNTVIWQDYGVFYPNHVYNSTSICFKPPVYHNQGILEPVKVFLQLVRPSDKAASAPIPFEYLPLEKNLRQFTEYRRRRSENQELLLQFVQSHSDVFPQIPETVNEINREESSASHDLQSMNFLPSASVNLDNASEVCEILNIDTNHIHLQPIEISSGDLDMGDFQNLSGTLQENLVI